MFEWKQSSTIPIAVFALASCIKLLLTPAYRSTDFEVHRNWLAITHSLPLSEWYYESTSEWTLDYPPFFAWFEYGLSQLAVLVDPLIVQLDNFNYSTSSCVLFQRLTVIVSDLTLLYAVLEYGRYHGSKSPVSRETRPTHTVSILLLFNYGLLVVDHIHFQYNGFMFGILLLSIVRLLQGRCLEGAFWFACLLNLKHIFLYVAPAYFVYLLKHLCFKQTDPKEPQKSKSSTVRTVKVSLSPSFQDFDFQNFVKLGALVVAVFVFSFGPFVYMGQLGQVISRLFPFKRGLCHAYWAPNVWALYSLADKVIAVIGTKLGLSVVGESSGSMTSGLVGEMSLQVLPAVSPSVTMALTLAAMLPGLVKLWVRPSTPFHFLKMLVLCAYSSFLFGWHVHEKAVMMITLPMCLIAVEKRSSAKTFLFLSTAGHVSLFPLLHKTAETPIKLSLFVLCSLLNFMAFQRHFRADVFSNGDKTKLTVKQSSLKQSDSKGPRGLDQKHWFSWTETAYIVMLFIVQFYCLLIYGLFDITSRFEFLPLLLTSVSCAVGVVWTWIVFYIEVLLR